MYRQEFSLLIHECVQSHAPKGRGGSGGMLPQEIEHLKFWGGGGGGGGESSPSLTLFINSDVYLLSFSREQGSSVLQLHVQWKRKV